jgi:hypothetical protein
MQHAISRPLLAALLGSSRHGGLSGAAAPALSSSLACMLGPRTAPACTVEAAACTSWVRQSSSTPPTPPGPPGPSSKAAEKQPTQPSQAPTASQPEPAPSTSSPQPKPPPPEPEPEPSTSAAAATSAAVHAAATKAVASALSSLTHLSDSASKLWTSLSTPKPRTPTTAEGRDSPTSSTITTSSARTSPSGASQSSPSSSSSSAAASPQELSAQLSARLAYYSRALNELTGFSGEALGWGGDGGKWA